jgi:DNA repair protein RecN (Recombination protein N)
MLTALDIRHFTIIDHLSLDFESGLCVLTGETGAGKSIWVDAIAYGLGAKADNRLIPPNQTQCDITLTFDLTNSPEARALLHTLEFDTESPCLIHRTIYQNKPTRVRINERPVTLSTLKKLAPSLLHIHGQHAYQTLLQSSQQTHALDAYGQHEALTQAVATHSATYQRITDALETAQAQQAEQAQQHALLTYQHEELAALGLGTEEFETLAQECLQRNQAEDQQAALSELLHLLKDQDDHSLIDLGHQAQQQTEQLARHHAPLQETASLIQSAVIQLEESYHNLVGYQRTLETTPERLAYLEQRLAEIHQLARKHKVAPEQLYARYEAIGKALSLSDEQEATLTNLQAQQTEAAQQYQQAADQLTTARQAAADRLMPQVSHAMAQLGMTGGAFYITLTPTPGAPHRLGQERVTFSAITNPGHPAQPIADIASGGELSRINLALLALTHQDQTGITLIFDEVDTGVGGHTADMIGRLLKQISQQQQVLCITHLAQVAAQGNHHYQIKKTIVDNHTRTHAQRLKGTDRIEELARMMSGATINAHTRAQAAELLEAVHS